MLEHHSKDDFEMPKITRIYVTVKELLMCKYTILRSSVNRFYCCVLPGTGASIASAVSHIHLSKKIVDKEKYIW